jgi:hypothetical protein
MESFSQDKDFIMAAGRYDAIPVEFVDILGHRILGADSARRCSSKVRSVCSSEGRVIRCLSGDHNKDH